MYAMMNLAEAKQYAFRATPAGDNDLSISLARGLSVSMPSWQRESNQNLKTVA
jgi:hypothetical protein